MMLTLILIIAAAFGAIIVWYFHYYKYIYSLKNVNGPLPLPLVGNALEFKSCKTILDTMDNYFKTHGKIVKFMLGVEPVIAIADYKAMETVLSSNKIIKKSPLYRFFHKWLNSGLLISEGTKWKQRRRILTPTYHFQILEQFIPIFAKVGNILVHEFRKNAQKKDVVDVYPYVTLSTLDVICETAMGVPINAQLNKTSAYVTSVKEMGRIVIERIFNPYQQFEFLYKFTENYKTEQECLKIMHGHTKSVISQRRKELKRLGDGSTEANVEDDFGAKKRVAFLDLLLQCKDERGEPLTNEDIQEEVDTFMLAGHDTTASGISFALYEIANHPKVQQKIFQEQQDILGRDDREFTYKDLNEMKYLELVIKETLRLYPPVPFFSRQNTKEFKLTEDVTLPPGYTLMLLVKSIQRDPEFFHEPETFCPERFLQENKFGNHPYSFIPFSAGPRNCIGQKFAYLEMKMMLSEIVRNFVLAPVVPAHKLELSAQTILKSENGILIKMKERN